jgi:tetratricopeptide (TPR) repeat protein
MQATDKTIKTISALRTRRAMISNTQQQNAIQQNNAAAGLITAGKYKNAIQELSFALKTYKQVMIEANERNPQPAKTSLDQCMVQSLAIADCRKAGHDNDDNDQDYVYIYRQAIHIPLEDIVESNYEESAMTSSMIVFNVALAYHLSALASNKHRSKKLHKAATLYLLAVNLQRNAQLENNNVLFTMAAMNNLGVIYHQLEDRETATKFFQHLLTSVMLLVDCGEVAVCCAGVLDGFLRNAINLVSEESSCAAPAA